MWNNIINESLMLVHTSQVLTSLVPAILDSPENISLSHKWNSIVLDEPVDL